MEEVINIKPCINVSQNPTLGDIVTKYRKRLLGFIRLRVKSEEDAEDVLQDVFQQLIESMRLMQPIEQLTGWLFTVARNRITDLYRKKRPVLMSFLEADDEDEDQNLSVLRDVLLDNDHSPELSYLRSLVWTELYKALDELPEEQKNVFIWHELEGRSFKEIASFTGETVNTLISRKRYAVLYLREQLKDMYKELIDF